MPRCPVRIPGPSPAPSSSTTSLPSAMDAALSSVPDGVGSNQGGVGIKEPSTNSMQCHTEPLKRNGCPPPDIFRDDSFQIHTFEEEFEDNIWSTLNEDVALTMSECVVSLASFNGDTRCSACTGICINCNPLRILTSASLVRTSGDGNKIDHNLRLRVCLHNKRHVTGRLIHYDLRYNVAVVEIMGFCSFGAVELEKNIPFTPNSEVVAVGCLFEHRKLMASRGVLIDRKAKLACEQLRISTCEISKAGIGGPLIDTCGNFVGMNFFHEEETPYLPRKKIQEVLGYSDDECGQLPKQYWFSPPFCVSQDLRSDTKEDADAAFFLQLYADQEVYFDTEEEAYSLRSSTSSLR